MPDGPLTGRLILELIKASNSSASDEEAARGFSAVLAELFGLQRATISLLYRDDRERRTNALQDYVINTKKPFVDNQLSEYSSFPELITFKNAGYKSCAILPIYNSGKATALIELLSGEQGRFSDEMVQSIELLSGIMGIALLYKYESSKNLRIANYFNSAFSSPVPQLLASTDGVLVKANKEALKVLSISNLEAANLAKLFGLSKEMMSALAKGSMIKASSAGADEARMFALSANMISERLMHVSAQDITELEEMALILGSMGKDSKAGVLYIDRSLNISWATDNIENLIGYKGNIMVGKSFIELVAERDKENLRHRLDGLTEQQPSASGIFGMINKDSIPVGIRYVVTRWINGYIMVFADAEAEMYIKSIRESLQDFIDSSSDIVLSVDPMGHITSCNSSVESALHYQKAELLGKEINSLYSDPKIIDRDISYVKNGGKIDNSYVDLLSKGGGTVSSVHSMRAFKDGDETTYLIVAKELETGRKLRDWEKSMEDMSKTINSLKSTGELKSQFIYNISHELKTPLTNIKGFSKLMLEGEFGKLNDEQQGYVTTILDEADRLVLMIQQVLDAARLESEKMKLETKDVNLKDLAENPSIKALQESARNKGIEFSWTVAFDVPAVTADQNRLIQVFVNLIGNSIKFTNSGGSIKVEVSNKSKGVVVCKVVDTGIGISIDDQRKLFRKFYEAPKKGLVKPEGTGTGLGLSITKQIITLHNGKIGVESDEGKGSTFWFTLPVKPKRSRKKPAIQQA
ncbi:MAG TPA: ATP-binding protein [Candidatus Acidoferrales bacterium]|nr:ATP-binding protein [Candidatus Acidoferrales bacterium]